jgi:hypothetical protein
MLDLDQYLADNPDDFVIDGEEDLAECVAPRLEISGNCTYAVGVFFTVTNSGGPIPEDGIAYTWTSTSGAQGQGTLDFTDNVAGLNLDGEFGEVTLDLGQYGSTTTSGAECLPEVEATRFEIAGACEYGVGTTFVATSVGGPLPGDVGYRWTSTSGASGEGTLAFVEGVAMVELPGEYGEVTFDLGQYGSLTTDSSACEPETVTPPCGVTMEDKFGFPIINMNPALCNPDQMQPFDWTPITVGAGTCPDFIVYHNLDMATRDLEIFRLGNPPSPPVSDNLSQGIGERIYDTAPSLSPDGEWITFASARDGNWEIYIAPTTGDANLIQRVTYNNEAIDIDPVWSPVSNDPRIIYESTIPGGQFDLYLFDASTGEHRRLTDNPGNDINAFWSPDGSKVVFQSDRDGLWQIYELDIATGVEKKLSDGSGDDHDPQYSFDGEQIVFRSYRDGDTSVLYLMDADGANPEAISDPAGNATHQAWYVDDSIIAYQSDLDGDQDIYIYELETGKTRLVTDNDIDDYAPTWWCDAPIVIFTSDVDVNDQTPFDVNIFQTPALPIDADPIDVKEEATQLTFDQDPDNYPENAPPEENASRQGSLPSPAKHQ